MTRIFYALNIGTLATWLSVAGFGSVGIALHGGGSRALEEKARDRFDELQSIALTEDFDVGDPPDAAATEAGSAVALPEEALPQPPQMPELAESGALPEIPELPEPVAAAAPSPPVSKPTPQEGTRLKPATRATTGRSPQGPTTRPGKTGAGGSAGSTGQSDANRLAGGRTPSPSYPAEARSKGQTGTVLVEFVVGADGRVISAYASRPSPWPLLNERAVSAVLRWKFQPGSIVKFTKPIVFKLN